MVKFVLGSIHDSCPNRISKENAYNSVTLTSKSEFFNFMVSVAFAIYGLFIDVPELDKNYFDRLCKSKVFSPQLYFYSMDDQVCPSPIIENWINEEKKRVLIFKKSWQVSKHVGHFQKHPEGYKKTTKDFIDHCIQSKL